MLTLTVAKAILRVLALAALVIHVGACQQDQDDATGDNEEDRGRLRVELTDAPSDDPDIATVYVTLAGVNLEEESLENISVRQTVDISNWTAGSTIQLGSDQLVPLGHYSGLTLTLDLGNDAPGDGPGCYVEREDGRKDPLGRGAGKVTVTLPGEFVVSLGTQTRLVVDIDLRKAISYDAASDDYVFADEADLVSCMRVVDAAQVGGIEGRVAPVAEAEGTVRVVYAYQAGQVDLNRVRTGDIAANFASTRVSEAGHFKFAFLPAGGYELIAVDYADTDGDGHLEFRGARSSDAAIGAVTRSVVVSVGAQVSASLSLGGLLP